MTRIYDKPRPFVMLVDKGTTDERREAFDLNRITCLSDRPRAGAVWVNYDDGTKDGMQFNTSTSFDDLYAAWADVRPEPGTGSMAIRMQHALDCPVRRYDANTCTCGLEAKKP